MTLCARGGWRRREWLAGLAAWGAAGCSGTQTPPAYAGGWVGANIERGHRLREATAPGSSAKSGAMPAPTVARRAAVLILGAGIAGLAAARAVQRAGIDDVHVLELEDAAGGNSRGHRLGGIGCPLGAHYLPLPGPQGEEIAEWLTELGLRREVAGRAVYDERHLCHSPQERLYLDGHWQDGLLPRADGDAALRTDYRSFAQRIDTLRRTLAFALPTARAAWTPAHAALDAQTFDAWLDAHGLHHPKLRWYLDYCCRDDYGAGSAQVSAWAGLHYFASRHGFHAPGDVDDATDAEGVLTWPQGNAWLVEKLAAPLGDRLHPGSVAWRVSESRHGVQVQVWNAAAGTGERWTAGQVVLAMPLFVSARLLDTPPPALAAAVAQQRHAPWLVANLQLAQPLLERPGVPLSWDNVIYDAAVPASTSPFASSLGYVDAQHQSLSPDAPATVLTAYWALGGRSAGELQANRQRLLQPDWRPWAAAVAADLTRAHPDLPRQLRRVDLMRWGHAMSVPVPGLRGSAALGALASMPGRVHFAHADLSAYSVFEEAWHHGGRAGRDAARPQTGA